MFLGVQRQAADRQLFAGGNPGPAQQRLHPQQQLIQIDGLDHVVVNPRLKAALLGRKVVPGGHKQDGNFLVELPHRLCKGKSVHTRHHDIGNDEVKQGSPVHGVIGFVGVQAPQRLIAVLVEIGAHRSVQFLVVLDY